MYLNRAALYSWNVQLMYGKSLRWRNCSEKLGFSCWNVSSIHSVKGVLFCGNTTNSCSVMWHATLLSVDSQAYIDKQMRVRCSYVRLHLIFCCNLWTASPTNVPSLWFLNNIQGYYRFANNSWVFVSNETLPIFLCVNGI